MDVLGLVIGVVVLAASAHDNAAGIALPEAAAYGAVLGRRQRVCHGMAVPGLGGVFAAPPGRSAPGPHR